MTQTTKLKLAPLGATTNRFKLVMTDMTELKAVSLPPLNPVMVPWVKGANIITGTTVNSRITLETRIPPKQDRKTIAMVAAVFRTLTNTFTVVMAVFIVGWPPMKPLKVPKTPNPGTLLFMATPRLMWTLAP